MAATANQLRPKCQDPGGLRHCGVLEAIHIYSGTMVFYDVTTGYLTDTDNGGANAFAGISENEYDNTDGASGDIVAEFWTMGSFELTGSGFTQADVAKAIYATDNNTISTSSATASRIGTCDGFVSATKLSVRIQSGVDLLV